MKRPLRPPRFLPEVLQAIYELKETGGSNSTKIVNHVRSSLRNVNMPARNLSTQIRRALNHATSNGIVRQRAGKFRINTALLSPFKDCEECRRRKRMEQSRRRRRRRKQRKHSITPTFRSRKERSDSETIRLGSDSEDEIPARELRRRRRGGGKKKRRKSGRKHRNHGIQQNQPPREERRMSMDQLKQEIYPDDHRESDNNLENSRQCDNPDCLCNVKDEIEDHPNFDANM